MIRLSVPSSRLVQSFLELRREVGRYRVVVLRTPHLRVDACVHGRGTDWRPIGEVGGDIKPGLTGEGWSSIVGDSPAQTGLTSGDSISDGR
jgi:hypothetical protein